MSLFFFNSLFLNFFSLFQQVSHLPIHLENLNVFLLCLLDLKSHLFTFHIENISICLSHPVLLKFFFSHFFLFVYLHLPTEAEVGWSEKCGKKIQKFRLEAKKAGKDADWLAIEVTKSSKNNQSLVYTFYGSLNFLFFFLEKFYLKTEKGI